MTWAQNLRQGAEAVSNLYRNQLQRLKWLTHTPVGWLRVGATDGELINWGQSIFSHGCGMTTTLRSDVHQHWKFCNANKKKNKTWEAIIQSFESSHLHVHTWGADMGRNGHVWTQTQEVTFVGLLILRAVRHWAHTAHRQQRLMESKTEHNMWLINELITVRMLIIGENYSGKSQRLCELAESPYKLDHQQ